MLSTWYVFVNDSAHCSGCFSIWAWNFYSVFVCVCHFPRCCVLVRCRSVHPFHVSFLVVPLPLFFPVHCPGSSHVHSTLLLLLPVSLLAFALLTSSLAMPLVILHTFHLTITPILLFSHSISQVLSMASPRVCSLDASQQISFPGATRKYLTAVSGRRCRPGALQRPESSSAARIPLLTCHPPVNINVSLWVDIAVVFEDTQAR